jgi:hypothetical protein
MVVPSASFHAGEAIASLRAAQRAALSHGQQKASDPPPGLRPKPRQPAGGVKLGALGPTPPQPSAYSLSVQLS